MTAFNEHCTQCHDAQKALSKSKSLDGWRSTVRRMADKDGAEIPPNVHEAIATYLASLTTTASSGSASNSSGDASSTSFSATISPLWLGGGSHDLQRPGFFPNVWVGAAWQGSGPISGRVTSCITCHNEIVSRLELVEAVGRFDVNKWLRSRCGGTDDPIVRTSIEAGRFVVPFGAYYQQVNPGVDRTVTRPLIYNMGQRLTTVGFPVLPMPYADEGANVNTKLKLSEHWNATLDAYVVNGLAGNNGIDFVFLSRDYTDNNRTPSTGGRVTIGNENFRIGGSVTGGQYNSDFGIGPNNLPLRYSIYGADVSYRYEDIFRFQAEYARRDTNMFFDFPDFVRLTDNVSGCYVEGEVLLRRDWKVSFIARYDMLLSTTPNAPSSGLPPTKQDVRIFTYGLNWTLPGGSLLMIGDDHWFQQAPNHDVDVVGVRWATTF
jgi:hypothetical protein